ncbi:hypothetical protein pipiens_013346 [Culex pipiens pipiens]|uniref:EGF-like domain-containing protein n=1 Tax=Culex pipiens pipiens TaxID=38569 RepID=A0ABD1CYR7_CULPP
MSSWIVAYALLAILPLIVGQNCTNTVSTPYLATSSSRISRNTICHHKCWFWWKKQIDTSFNSLDHCSVNYKTEKQSVCCEGYKKISSGKCEPICHGCQNGRCTAPNECSCDKGFRNWMGICVPICDNPACGHGTCEAPGKCSCHEGYELDSAKGCVPKCDPPCLNGECVARNTCECFFGHQKTSESNVCVPVCDPKLADCGSGTCAGPNRCLCVEGFVFEKNRCVPHCDPPCVHGSCTKPNICSCREGFVNSVANPAECIPFCDGGCQNGTCVAPGTCECLGGFEQSNDDPNVCEPSCDPMFVDTRRGECVAPNVLKCEPGYVLDYSTLSGRMFCRKM